MTILSRSLPSESEPVIDVDATPWLAPYPEVRVVRPVTVEVGKSTYGPGESLETSWLPIAFRAFARVRSRIDVRRMVIVGTGCGLDALGALEIFDLRALTVTDLDTDALAIARRNIARNLAPDVDVELGACTGDLLAGVPASAKHCLIYENLPNLPAPPGLALSEGALVATFFDPHGREVPERFARRLLSLHYQCLQQARSRLRPGGAVLTSIGGRIPLDMVTDLHRSLGYSPELVAYDLKIQSEAEIVVPAFHAAEKAHGLTFRYYLPEARAAVGAMRRSGGEAEVLEAAFSSVLDRWAITSEEASQRLARREPVAHSVYMVLGRWDGPDVE